MIDLKVLQGLMQKYSELLSMDKECLIVGELQEQACIDDQDMRSNDHRLVNFDAFGFAWNRQSRDHKLRIVAAAYRTHKSLFSASDQKNRIEWEQLTLAQQVVIRHTSQELLQASLSVFVNAEAAAQFMQRRIKILSQKEAEFNSLLLDAMRIAA